MAMLLPLHLSLCATLAGLAAAGAWTDLHERRIPNWLAATGLCAGVVLQTGIFGGSGLRDAVLGTALALLVYLPLYALRAIGGGDVKLMAAVGALAGPSHWLVIFVIASLAGGIWALLLVVSRGMLRRTLANAVGVVADVARFRPPWRRKAELDIEHPRAVSVPHGAAVALSIFVFLALG